ncbi:MAG: chemotaxis protein CheC [Clostridia bacterium]|nr:chemotaxis protein CheC [Clostridia bacterium]
MANYDNFNEFQLDVFREIGNIGSGNAATALSYILKDKVNITVPVLEVIGVNEISNILGGPENQVVGILLSMTGQINGMLLFLLEKETTHMLLNILLNEDMQKFEDISEIGLSALMEIGNILSGSYIGALSSLLNLEIRLTIPKISVDMVGAILNYPAAIFGEMGEKLMLIEENFFTDESSIKSHLLIMPELESLEVILKSLGAI